MALSNEEVNQVIQSLKNHYLKQEQKKKEMAGKEKEQSEKRGK